jgi:hypothetical protein
MRQPVCGEKRYRKRSERHAALSQNNRQIFLARYSGQQMNRKTNDGIQAYAALFLSVTVSSLDRARTNCDPEESKLKPAFSQEAMKARAFIRIANVLKEHAEEGRFPHSRIFETLMPDEWIISGKSVNGGGWREHVVPCAYLARQCIHAFENGASVDAIAVLLEKYLKIVHITPAERHVIDFELGYRSTMPGNWVFGEGAPLQRLIEAKIVLEEMG